MADVQSNSAPQSSPRANGRAREATTSLANWKFQSQHVQQNLTGGNFIGSHSVIICATVPRLADLNDAATSAVNNSANGAADLTRSVAVPIGVVDSMSLSQQKQLSQIFEIGSKRSYIMNGRTLGSMQMQRVFYKGPNLVRMLYAYYPTAKLNVGGDSSNELREGTSNANAGPVEIPAYAGTDDLSAMSPDNRAGYDNVFLNLDSNIFSQPYGIIIYIKDNDEEEIAAICLEECYIENHVMGISANSIIIAEQVQMRFERIVPIKVKYGQRTDAAAGGGSNNPSPTPPGAGSPTQ